MGALTCSRAQQLVLQPVGDAREIASARQHVLECPLCASDTSGDIQEVHRILQILRNPSVIRRSLLFVASIIQLALALPWMFGETLFWGTYGESDVSHLTRDGAIGLMFGVIGIAVARSPRLAYFAVTISGLLAILQLAAFVSDRAEGHVHTNFEVIHLLSALVCVLIISMAYKPRSAK